MQLHLKYALFVVAGIMVVVGLSIWTGLKKPVATPAQLRRVVDRAAEHNTASHSGDAVGALVDVTTALASLDTAVALSGDACVARAAGVSPRTLENEMRAHQMRLVRQLGEPAPFRESLPPLPSI